MNNFFKNIYRRINDNRISSGIIEALDWLFDDKKFDETIWQQVIIDRKGKKRYRTECLNKEIMKDCSFNNNNYIYGKHDDIHEKMINHNTRGTYIVFDQSEPVCIDFIRHIRNGIAHSNTKFSDEFIEILDYKSKGRTQTAYIYMKIENIIKIHKCYKLVKTMRL